MTSSHPVEYHVFQAEGGLHIIKRIHVVICQPLCTSQITTESISPESKPILTVSKPRKHTDMNALHTWYNQIVQRWIIQQDYEEIPIPEYRKPIDFDKVLAEEDELIGDANDPLYLEIGDDDD